MLITRECDYAVRVLRAMAEEKRVSVNEICEKELITAPFAYKILKKLQKSGMVRGYRGVHGGYSLNCDLDQIRRADIYIFAGTVNDVEVNIFTNNFSIKRCITVGLYISVTFK